MRIFNYNPAIMDLNNYYQSIESNNTVKGVFINVVLNESFDLEVFFPDINVHMPLTEFLNQFKNSKKLIIMNMLLVYQLVTDKTSLEISNYNNVFVQKLIQVISKYPNEFYLCSISTSILYFLKINPLPYKIGTIITRADLGFIDVDFYVFSEYFINIEFINSLLDRNKEVMVFPDNSDLINNLPDDIKNRIDYIIQTPS